MNKLLGLATTVIAMTAATAQAQELSGSGMFSLQGRLTTSSGEPVADGSHSLTINVYGAGNGSAIHTETDMVTTVDGVFSTMVGDNGANGALTVDAGTRYELGLSVDGQTEFGTRLPIGDAVSAMSADVAANAETVGGIGVSTAANPMPGTLVPLDANGRLSASLLGNSTVTSINGIRGNVNLDVTGQGVSLDTTGGRLRLNITGGGGGSFTLPFSGNANTIGSGMTGFRISGAGEGSVAGFTNTGAGSALSLSSTGNAGGAATIDVANTGGTAINATGSTSADAILRLQNSSNGVNGRLISGLGATGNAVFDVMTSGQTKISSSAATALDLSTNAAASTALHLRNTSTDAAANLITGLDASGATVLDVAANGQTTIAATAGTGLSVTTNAAADAALRVQNSAAGGSARLISAVNAGGTTVLDVAANGQTKINSTVGNALEVATTAAGEAALKVTGGLTLNGAAGTGTVDLSNGNVTVNNPLAKANSIILVTVTGGTNLNNIVPLRVSSQTGGSFTVSAIPGALGSLTGNVGFNYLIINQ